MPRTAHTVSPQYATRRERFRAIRSGYEADGPDATVPGASASVARYAVVTESLRGHGYFVNYAVTLAHVETVAAANMHEGWQPVCYYDLDELDGPEPPAQVGDLVQIVGSDRRFELSDVGCVNAGAVHYFDSDGIGVGATDCSIVQRHPDSIDERDPKRYLVAKIVTLVAFDTQPARWATTSAGYLDLSTAHVTEQVMRDIKTVPGVIADLTPYGAWVWVPADVDHRISVTADEIPTCILDL